MAVLTVSADVENVRATSLKMGLSANPFEPTTLTANIKAGTGEGACVLRLLRFCMPGFYWNKIRVNSCISLFHKSSNAIRQNLIPMPDLDDRDRKLLTLLADDATPSYAELGKLLNLSAPAVHERVKRLKRDGLIKGIAAKLDGARIGRPLLAFVHVDTNNWTITQQVLGLAELTEVEEIHTITGKSAMLLKVRVRDTQALELLLARIHQIEGITNTTSDIALTSYLERGPLPDDA